MKIGLISDVHADLAALELALKLLRDRHQVQRIWCAGDLVGRGRSPNEVVARINQERLPVVMGNHDEMILIEARKAKGDRESAEDNLEVAQNRNSTLNLRTKPAKQAPLLQVRLSLPGYLPETLNFLLSLPRTYRTCIEGRTLVMVHGTPRSNLESLSPAPLRRRETLHWLRQVGADILIAGHTHVPMMIKSYDGLIVNPGSLFNAAGLQRSSSETYGVLDVSDMAFQHYPLRD